MEEPDRYFTLQEAQALVAWLQRTFDTIEPLKDELASARARVRSFMARIHSNGGASPEEELQEATRTLHETQERIDQLAYSGASSRAWWTFRRPGTAARYISAGWLASPPSPTGMRPMWDLPDASHSRGTSRL